MLKYTFRHILTPDGMLHDRTLTVGQDGRITAIDAASASAPRDGNLALPGMPNAHSHAFQRALAGHGEARSDAGRDSFWSWREAMYRLARRVSPEDCGAIARHAYAEMLATGFTSVAEFHYLHHLPSGMDGARGVEMAEAMLDAARATGIRLTLLPVLYLKGGFGKEPLPEQHRFVHASVDDYLDLLDRLRPLAVAHGATLGIAPHSLRAVPATELAALLDGARALLGADTPVHIHIAEQTAEVEQCHAAHGCGPVELLARTVALDARWNLIHATHADARERAQVRASGATVVICPLTEAHLGDGLYPVEEHANAPLAIGSDSNCRIDAFEELRAMEYGARLRNRARAQLADSRGLGVPLWLNAVKAGAQALAQPVAGIAVGQQADLVVFGDDAPALAGHGPNSYLDALVINGSARDVELTIVGGKRIAPLDTRTAFHSVVRQLLP